MSDNLANTWDRLHARLGHDAITGPGYQDETAYDESGKQMLERIIDATGPLDGKVVLDYGCGDGRVARHVQPLCKSLICADVSPVALAKLKARTGILGRLVDADNIGLMEGFADPAPPELINLDLIYAWHVAHHNPRLWTFRLIVGAFRRLRPGGHLLFDYCNFYHPTYVPILRRKTETGWMADFPHVMLSASELIHYAVEVAGFRFALALDDERHVLQPTIVCYKARCGE